MIVKLLLAAILAVVPWASGGDKGLGKGHTEFQGNGVGHTDYQGLGHVKYDEPPCVPPCDGTGGGL